MDAELRLASKLAQSGGVGEAIIRGITAQHFADEKLGKAFDTMREHFVKYGQPIPVGTLRTRHPDYAFEPVSDVLGFCIDEFILSVKRRLAIKAVTDIAEMANDPAQTAKIEEAFLDRARDLSHAVPHPSLASFRDVKSRIDEYEAMVKSGKSPIGIELGIPSIDAVTMGVQPHEMVIITGWLGMGKSTLLQHIALNAFLAGKSSVYVSLEMEKKAILRRIDVMATKKVDYYAMKAGKLSSKEIGEWRGLEKRLQTVNADIKVVDDVGKCTVDTIYSLASQHKPDMMVVDYLTLMTTTDVGKAASDWEKVNAISKNLKLMSRSLGIPVIAAAQQNVGGSSNARRGGGGAALENIGGSKSIGADADIVIGLHQDPDMVVQRMMELRLMKNRDGRQITVNMVWDHERMDFREATGADVFKATKERT